MNAFVNSVSQAAYHYQAAFRVPGERTLPHAHRSSHVCAAALGFQPEAYDNEIRLPMKCKRASRAQYHICLFILIGLCTNRTKEMI
jgi:hypothetical protein